MLACYTNTLSVEPGESFTLFASSSTKNCDLEIARVGGDRQVVYTRADLEIGDHPIPPDVEIFGCDWPAAWSVTVGEDWATGYYDIVLTSQSGERANHFVCVRKAAGTVKAKAVLVLATNTYHAYNWWGGRNAYSDVVGLATGALDLVTSMERGVGVLSTRRPFPHGLLAMIKGAPRLMNDGIRGFKETPVGPDPKFWQDHGYTTFDVPAGYLNKWEHAFVEWAAAVELELDYLTDYDLDINPAALDGYSVMLAVGHSEYWSGRQRDTVDAFVDGGGNLAVLSGNTSYWKVRWEADGKSMICHKWKGFDAEPLAGADGTHMWSHPAFGKPEAALIGLSFLFGGYHRLGICVARGSGGYTIYNDRHWALEGADLAYGDQLGADIPLLGYENDGCLFEFDDERLLKPIPQLGVPANLEIIGVAPCSYGEDLSLGYPAFLPAEDLNVAAKVVYGNDEPATIRKLLRGHAVIASFKRGKGEVFNVGTTEWAHALNARNPMIEQITMNVLRRFGAFTAA
ncbi:hypothetical protein FQZ97_460010 [compost metagenome]